MSREKEIAEHEACLLELHACQQIMFKAQQEIMARADRVKVRLMDLRFKAGEASQPDPRVKRDANV